MLWCAVSALQRALPSARVLVLCDEGLSARALREAARRTFGVELPRDVEVVPLTDVARLNPDRHPRLTLVSQSLAGAALAFQGLRRCCGGAAAAAAAAEGNDNNDGDNGSRGGLPALFVDTSGWSLSYFVARAAGCSVAAYVHYPIVSSDMLLRVRRESGENKKEGAAALAVAGDIAGDAGVSGNSSSSSPSLPLALALLLRTRLRSWVKTGYYHFVAAVYGAAGGACCDVAVVNSSWTAGHLEQLWWRRPKGFFGFSLPSSPRSSWSEEERKKNKNNVSSSSFSSSTIVYPPCGVSSLQDLPLERAPLPEEVFGKRRKKGSKEGGEEGRLLIALAQFRPEKNQAALLRALALARRRAAAAAAADASPSSRPHPVLSAKLALVGGVRDAADAARVEALRELAAELGLVSKKKSKGDDDESGNNAADAVVFVANAPRETLRNLLSSALGGLHAMVDEHFGICVVEYMAAGVVPVAHASAGPRMDIVREEEGEEGEEGGGGEEGEEGEEKRAPPSSAVSQKRERPRTATPTGFLCSTEEEYADAISELLLLSQESRGKGGGGEEEEGGKGKPRALEMAAAARRRARRLFSDERFDEGFLEALRPLLSRVERGCEEAEKKKKRKAS